MSLTSDGLHYICQYRLVTLVVGKDIEYLSKTKKGSHAIKTVS